MLYLYFDKGDDEWSVHAYGQNYSDVAAIHDDNPEIRAFGEAARVLNINGVIV